MTGRNREWETATAELLEHMDLAILWITNLHGGPDGYLLYDPINIVYLTAPLCSKEEIDTIIQMILRNPSALPS